jgi:hypothetical protein
MILTARLRERTNSYDHILFTTRNRCYQFLLLLRMDLVGLLAQAAFVGLYLREYWKRGIKLLTSYII